MTEKPPSITQQEHQNIINQQVSRLLGALLTTSYSQFQLSIQAIDAQLPKDIDLGRTGGTVAAHFLASFCISFASAAVGDRDGALSDEAKELVAIAADIMMSNAPIQSRTANPLH